MSSGKYPLRSRTREKAPLAASYANSSLGKKKKAPQIDLPGGPKVLCLGLGAGGLWET